MRAYVTGGGGFVGRWLNEYLRSSGDAVVAVDRELDVTDAGRLADSIDDARPEVVYHLAGRTHVGRSWEEPERTFTVNALGTLHVLEAASRLDPPARVIVVSSAEVYGHGGDEPFDETSELRPITPYAASKVAAEFLGLQYFLGRGLEVVRVRPFNHVGPGQSADFVIAGLARRIVVAERAGGGDVAVGNLAAARDFTDVRDVVRAYRLLAETGRPGEAYNLASGRAVTISDVAEKLRRCARAPVRFVADPSLSRPVDVPLVVGAAGKIAAETGWSPAISLEETLADVLEFWRDRP